jgi:hypothetical protein
LKAIVGNGVGSRGICIPALVIPRAALLISFVCSGPTCPHINYEGGQNG